MKTFVTVGDIVIDDYVESTHSISDILGNIADATDDIVRKSITQSMDGENIYITSNSQGYYEDRHSDHSVTQINNLVEIIPLMIVGDEDIIKIWNNGIDDDGDKFDSIYIDDLGNCFGFDSELYDFIVDRVENIADDIMNELIDAVRDRDESDYQDRYNYQAFEEFKSVNNIESDKSFYEFSYENSTKDVEGYTQITHDQYEELYIKLPELVEHKRETFDDGVLVRTETFYTFTY